ncbi:ATP-binding protein [Cellulomonas sp. S1-8]|uniref:ATP-binding protein n=1 Tax=Cellulomonas sp. S1-8 TaxID=2904790 RepID=UPI00224498E4|nr:DUF4143 domain-containing protein [Cellulomonas sp. S1-8]UZN02975.1 DUF4143 domain-containing protein [Cellulomonas sp. S1-8]
MEYTPRVADAQLADALRTAGAVLVEGPKACGKTETAKRVAATVTYLDTDSQARAAIDIDPELVLQGPSPHLLDEWQEYPQLWNHVRRAVDAAGEPGQFVLTGSSVPTDDVRRHSGAGRFARLRMRPLSLYEAGHSTGGVSLAALLHGEPARSPAADLPVPRLAELAVAGGWPARQGARVQEAAAYVREYVAFTCEVDVPRIGGPRRDPARVRRLMMSLARNVATEAPIATLSADTAGKDAAIDRETVADYLDVLGNLLLVEDQPPWAPHLRSSSVLRKSAKRHFTDPSIALAALGAGPERLLADLNYFGFVFESLVVRDLRVLSGPLHGEVLHYRDSSGLEVDAIVVLPDGTWGAFEVKLGAGHVESAAASLRKFAATVDQRKSGPPAVLGVITPGGYGYRREDGVDVVPLAALGP